MERVNITNIRDRKRATKQHEGVCPFTSIVKDQIAKARLLGIKYVSLVDITFGSFSSAKLYQQRISRQHVVMKKIYNFPEKSELPKFILSFKITVFIRLSAQGAYLILDFQGGRLFEVGAYSKLGAY